MTATAVARRPASAAPRLISVIVPVLNAEPWLGEQLAALAEQTYAGAWEVLVVDNGCSDRSMEVAGAWGPRLPDLRVVEARDRRSLNHARNAGARAARGDFLAFCDGDDVVAPAWLEALATAAPTADIVGGTFDIESLNSELAQAWRPDEPPVELPVHYGFLPVANGGNCGVWTSVALELGWDEAFDHGSSETEFCWRAQFASYRLAFVPEAVIRLRYRARLRDLVRQYFSYGRSGPPLYRRFRDRGMRRETAEAFAWWRWLARNVPALWGSRAQRGRWLRIAAFRCGRIWGSARARVLFP